MLDANRVAGASDVLHAEPWNVRDSTCCQIANQPKSFHSLISVNCSVQVPSMTVGGALWFTDLTVADPYYLLPIAASGVFLLTVELGAADGMQVRLMA